MAEIKSLNQLQIVQQINGNHQNQEKDLKMNVLHIFYDLIAELENEGPDFKQIQSKLVDKLDAAVFEHKCYNEFRQSFITLLYDKINVMDKPWKEKGIQMIQNLTKLTDLLIDYRLVLNEEESRDKQMTCIANLLHFYKNRIYKKELYVKYIYKLYDLHVQAENFTEIAFTLKLHADLFSWSFNPIKEFIMHNDNQILNQSTSDKLEWQRKEQLYLKIIDYFDKGKCWEEAISLLKEMEIFYEKHFEYFKLSNIIKKKATFYDNILTQFRFEPEYFRVAFFGLGFPLFLRNRKFIYKGNDFEKIGDFIQRISNEYPKAEILPKSNPPESEILKSNKQYIQIVTVKPIAELPTELELKQEIHEKICSYYLMNQVNTFVYDRPLHKDSVDKENEFKSLWCERTVLKTDHKLPGILRWFEVTDRKLYQLTPVENACDVIENMTKELKKLIISHNNDPNKQLTPLTMRLQGVIDASVNGGLRKYQEAFFDPNYIETHPNYYTHIKRLKKLIFNQINILESGLFVHKKLVPNSLLPLHEMLVEKFSAMKNSFICDSSYIVDIATNDKKPSILNTPLPPIPDQNRLKLGKELSFISNNGNSSEDDIYSVLEADGKLSRQNNLSPSSPSIINRKSTLSHNFNSTLNTNLNLNGNKQAFNKNGNFLSNHVNDNNKIVYVSVANQNQLINQRSNSIPRNSQNIQNLAFNGQVTGFDNLKQPSPTNLSNYPLFTTRSSLSKQSLESGIEADLNDVNKPILPKRSTKKSFLTADQSPILISVDIDKNKSTLNTVISSNTSYFEETRNQDIPPPLPAKKRFPSSRSTTIINIGNNELENVNSNVSNSCLITNNFFNNNSNNQLNSENGSLKSTSSSISTSSMSTSSSANDYIFTERQVISGSTTTTTVSSSSSSKLETIQHQIHTYNLNS